MIAPKEGSMGAALALISDMESVSSLKEAQRIVVLFEKSVVLQMILIMKTL